MPRIPTHTPDWTSPRPGDPGGTHQRAGVGTVIEVASLDFGGGASLPKPLVIDVPRGSLKQGQRYGKLTLRDPQGRTAMIELTHVVQQTTGRGRSAKNEPVDTVALNYAQARVGRG